MANLLSNTTVGGSAVITTSNIGSYALTSLPSHNHDDRYFTESESDSRYLRFTGAELTEGNYFQFRSNRGFYLGGLDSPSLQAYSTGGNAAFMSFHRSGNYAVNFGLDADNVMRIGGWSASSNRWQLDMSGNNTIAGNYYGGGAGLTGTASSLNVGSLGGYSLDTMKKYIWSRGENLLTNGTGLMGNNTNFGSFIFDGSQAYFSSGSFKYTGQYQAPNTDELMPMNPEKRYRLDFWAKTANGQGAYYAYLNFFDVDGNAIYATNHMYYPNTLTTLAQTLNPGDTVVYLTSAANWENGGTAGVSTHIRSFIFWNYSNSFGYLYPPQTYSRNWYGGMWNPGAVNYSNNTITLISPWSGPSIAAGTQLSNGSAGGTFKYIALGYTIVPTTWTNYVGIMDGVDYSGSNAGGKFPPGTASAKLGFLTDYNASGDTIYLANLFVGVDNDYPIYDRWTGNTRIEKSGAFYGTIFYDSNDSSFYLNPNATSRLSVLNTTGSITTDGYLYTNSSTRIGEIWGYGGVYKSSGEMMFGTEGYGWRWHSGNVQKAFLSSDGFFTTAGGIRVGSGDLYLDQNYGRSVVGVYSSYRYQGVWAMGDSYKLSADGTSTGNLYGLAWSHPDTGGQTKAGLEHQLLVMNYGVTQTAIGTGIWTSGLITTTSYGTSSNWNTAFGWGNHASAGYLTGITSGQVTGALGYTPYNSSNPSGYITSSGSISGNAGSVTNGVYTNSSSAISGDNHMTFGPNSTWSSYIRVGGNGRTVSGDAYASMVTTNGNLHLDGGNSRAIYLNYYAGTSGTAFGNGASNVVAWMGPDGDLWKGATDNTGSQYIYNSGTWGINITGTAESIASNPNRTDGTAYPVVWSNGNSYSPNYSCAAVTIQSSTGTLRATNFISNQIVVAYANISDTTSGSTWYGLGNAGNLLGGGNTVQLAGYFGVRIKTSDANMDFSSGSAYYSATFNSAILQQAGNQVLHAGNYTSYSPSLTGSGASGTWGISITGNSNYATTAGSLTSMNISQFTNNSGYLTSLPSHNHDDRYYTESEIDSQISGRLYQASVGTFDFNAFNGTGLYRGSTGSWSNRPPSGHNGGAVLQIDTHPGNYHSQLYFDTGAERLYFRNANAGTWGSWLTVLHSSNFNAYSPSLTGSNASGTWNINVTGSAGSVAWTNVSSRPTALSQLTNDLGNYGGWITSSGSITGNASKLDPLSGDSNYKLAYTADGARNNAGEWGRAVMYYVPNGQTYGIRVDRADYADSAGGVAWTNVSSRPTSLSQFTNDLGNYGGWITGITSGNVTTALGFTPYNSTNPNGYITSSASISGSSGSVSGLTLTSSANGINPDSVTQNQIGYNTSVSLFGQTDGGLYSSAFSSAWIHQIYGDFRTGQIAVRGKNSGTWQSWRTVLDSGNYTSYSPSLTGSGASGTWGISVTGNAGTVGGYAVSGTVGANTVVIRDVNGYIYAHYINSNVSETENPTINSFYTSNGDGWLRKSSVAHVKSQLGLGSLAYSSATIPTNTNQLTNGAGYITSSGSISGNAATATNVAWTGVTGRPTALSQFSNDLGNYGGFLTSLPAHTHAISDVTGLQTALDGKQASGSYLTTSGKAADSELFDGTDSIYFVKGNGVNTLGFRTTSNSGANSAGGLSSGFYDGSGMSNMPTSDWYHLIVNAHNNSSTSNQYEFHIATAFWDKSNFYVRSISPGDVGPWRTLIHNGNIGSQSVNYANSAGSASTATTAGTATIASQLNKFGDIYGQDWNGYYVQDKLIAAAVYGHSGANRPNLTYDYGVALSYGEATGPRMQMYFPENSPNLGTIFRKATYRTGWNGNWSTWKTLVEQEGNTCTIVGGNGTGLEVHGNVGYNQDPLTYFLLRGQADTSWKALKVRLTGDAGGQDIEFRRIAENGTDSRMWYVPRGVNTVNFDYPIVQPSDSRLKDNITPISTPVEKIKALSGVEFDWNSGEQVGTHDVGLIAQDVEAVLPEAVTTQEDGYKNLAYTKVIPLLVEAMKEQQTMIEALRAEIELLKNK
jgi:hypothetical protein